MTEKIELPPLPSPGVFDMSGKFGLGWTAEQMRSFASEAVRMAMEAERERCVEVAPTTLKSYAAWAGELVSKLGRPPTAAEVYEALVRKDVKLGEAASMLEEALSPFMEGTAHDDEWVARRDALIAAIRQKEE